MPTPQVLVDFYETVNLLESVLKNKTIPEADKIKLVTMIRQIVVMNQK